MNGVYILVPTLMTILISMMIVRAGAIALTMTGISYNRAKFQSLSAFTGTGFTTREAELVVNHPTRRQIVSWMMVLGNAGIVAVIITTTTSFMSTDIEVLPLNVAVLFVGILLLYLLATRTGLASRWEVFVEKRLGRSTLFEEGSVDELLHLVEGFGLVKLTLDAASPLVGQTIVDTGLPERGFRILGIERDEEWIAAPSSRQVLHEADRLVIYGPLDALRTLARND
tara:strand:- start:1366 stop:2046 length:681 start_codon:yes stop_codon:yes gene_type:complete